MGHHRFPRVWLFLAGAGVLNACTAAPPGTPGPAPTPAPAVAGARTEVGATPNLTLPAIFRGDLPCADCEAIRYRLQLQADNLFDLRREWLGRDVVREETGHWRYLPERRAVALEGTAEPTLQFEILDDDRLRLLDIEGRPIQSSLPYELVRAPARR